MFCGVMESGIGAPRTMSNFANSLVSITHDFTAGMFQEMAELHRMELSAGLLPLFGDAFLRKMYRFAVAFRGTKLIALLDGDQIAGFVMGSTGGGHFYRGLLLRTWPDILLALLRRPSAILRAVNVAAHVATAPDQAELMSIVVRPDFRGRGVAKRLLEDFRCELKAAGAKCFFVIAATTQPAALRFYEKAGGEVVRESTLGGLTTLTFRYDCSSR